MNANENKISALLTALLLAGRRPSAQNKADALGDSIANVPWSNDRPQDAAPTILQGLQELMRIGPENIDAIVLSARIREPRPAIENGPCPGCGQIHELLGGKDPDMKNNVFSIMVGNIDLANALLEYLRLEHEAQSQAL